jgi:hypothetical protein
LTKSDNSNAAVTLIMHILIKAKTAGKEGISCKSYGNPTVTDKITKRIANTMQQYLNPSTIKLYMKTYTKVLPKNPMDMPIPLFSVPAALCWYS